MIHRALLAAVPLALLAVPVAPSLAAAAAESSGGAEVILARWRGGELSQARFEARYDEQGRALAQGGEALRSQVCKAVYREIYAQRGLAAGLDRDPEVAAELARWRTEALARRYEQRHFSLSLDDATLQALYRRDLARDYTSPPAVSLDVLFVRCGLAATERASCRERMEELSARLAASPDAFPQLLTEERARSGKANGHFDRFSLSRLAPELRRAAAELPLGEVSAPIESLLGWYRLRVTERAPAQPLTYEQVAPAVRRKAAEEAIARWHESEVTALRGRLAEKLPTTATTDEVLAAAAVAEGFDREPDFLDRAADHRDWVLADAAFLRHAEVLPSEPELAAQLEQQAERYRRWRLTLATLPLGADLDATLARAERVAAALREAKAPAEELRQLAATLPELHVEEVGPVTAAELRERSVRLADLLPGLQPGSWQGPVPIAWRQLPPLDAAHSEDGTEAAPSLLFVSVAEARLPPLETVRTELLQAQRSRLGAGIESFLAVLEPVWGVELLVP